MILVLLILLKRLRWSQSKQSLNNKNSTRNDRQNVIPMDERTRRAEFHGIPTSFYFPFSCVGMVCVHTKFKASAPLLLFEKMGSGPLRCWLLGRPCSSFLLVCSSFWLLPQQLTKTHFLLCFLLKQRRIEPNQLLSDPGSLAVCNMSFKRQAETELNQDNVHEMDKEVSDKAKHDTWKRAPDEVLATRK